MVKTYDSFNFVRINQCFSSLSANSLNIFRQLPITISKSFNSHQAQMSTTRRTQFKLVSTEINEINSNKKIELIKIEIK